MMGECLHPHFVATLLHNVCVWFQLLGKPTLCIATDTAVLVYVFDMAINEAFKLATKM